MYVLIGVLSVLGLAAFVATLLSFRACRRQGPLDPDAFEVVGADMKPRTVTRRPVVDPPPCPDSAPGGALHSPGTSSKQSLSDSARALRRFPR